MGRFRGFAGAMCSGVALCLMLLGCCTAREAMQEPVQEHAQESEESNPVADETPEEENKRTYTGRDTLYGYLGADRVDVTLDDSGRVQWVGLVQLRTGNKEEDQEAEGRVGRYIACLVLDSDGIAAVAFRSGTIWGGLSRNRYSWGALRGNSEFKSRSPNPEGESVLDNVRRPLVRGPVTLLFVPSGVLRVPEYVALDTQEQDLDPQSE